MNFPPSIVGRVARAVVVLGALVFALWIVDANLMLRPVRTVTLTAKKPDAPFIHWQISEKPLSRTTSIVFDGSRAQLIIEPPRSLYEIDIRAEIEAPVPQNLGLVVAAAQRDRQPSVLFWDTRLVQSTLRPFGANGLQVWAKQPLSEAAAREILRSPTIDTYSAYLLPAIGTDATGTLGSVVTADYVIMPQPEPTVVPNGQMTVHARFSTREILRTFGSYVLTFRWPESNDSLKLRNVTVILKAKSITVGSIWTTLKSSLHL